MGITTSAEAIAFCSALRRGDCDEVVEAVTKNSKLAKAHLEHDGGTAWHIAASDGRLEVLRVLRDAVLAYHPTKPKYRKDPGLSPKVFEHLLNKRNALGQAPLTTAAMHGHAECAAWLLTQGADPWQRTEAIVGELSALHYAVKAGSRECVQALLDYVAADPFLKHGESRHGCRFADIRTTSHMTPLHYAAWFNRKELIALLFEFGGDITHQCYLSVNEEVYMPQGSTPLHVAARFGRAGVTRNLLTAYAVRLALNSAAVDPRLIRDGNNLIPFSVAMRYHQYHIVPFLHPQTDLHDIANILNPRDRVLGPPSLVQITSPIAQTVLLEEINALASGGTPAPPPPHHPAPARALSFSGLATADHTEAPVAPTSAAAAAAAPAAAAAAAGPEAGATWPEFGTVWNVDPAQSATATGSAVGGTPAGTAPLLRPPPPPSPAPGHAGAVRGLQRIAGTLLDSAQSERLGAALTSLHGGQSTGMLLSHAMDVARIERLSVGIVRGSAPPTPPAYAGGLTPRSNSSGLTPRQRQQQQQQQQQPTAPPSATARSAASDAGGGGGGGVPAAPLMASLARLVHLPWPGADPEARVQDGGAFDVSVASELQLPTNLPGMPPAVPRGGFTLSGALARPRPMPTIMSANDLFSMGDDASDALTAALTVPEAPDAPAAPGVLLRPTAPPSLARFSLSGVTHGAGEPLSLSIESIEPIASASSGQLPPGSPLGGAGAGGAAGQGYVPCGADPSQQQQQQAPLERQGSRRAHRRMSSKLLSSGGGGSPNLSRVSGAKSEEGADPRPAAAAAAAGEHQASVMSMVVSLQRASLTFTKSTSGTLDGGQLGAAGAAPPAHSTAAGAAGGSAFAAAAGGGAPFGSGGGAPTPPRLNDADDHAFNALAVVTTTMAEVLVRHMSTKLSSGGDDLDNMCGVCMNDDPEFLMMQPCRHTLCASCCRELVKIHTFKPSLCPFCRRVILGFARPETEAHASWTQHDHQHDHP